MWLTLQQVDQVRKIRLPIAAKSLVIEVLLDEMIKTRKARQL